jgi:hypothetical protein
VEEKGLAQFIRVGKDVDDEDDSIPQKLSDQDCGIFDDYGQHQNY